MKYTMFFAALAAMIVTVSCQKENIDSVNEELVFTASIVASHTKTTINTDTTDVDNRGKISWVKGDQITITDASTPAKSAVYVAASAGQTTDFTKKDGETDLGVGPYTATYGTAPLTTQSYDDYYSDANVAKNIYMTASTSSTTSKELTFTAACGLLRLNLTAASSEATKNISKIEIMGTPEGETATIYTLDCSTAKDISSAKEFYLALPEGSYSVMKFTNSTGHICYKTAKTAMTISNNTIQPTSISNIEFNDMLPGKFSVADNKQVKFSRGNLRAKKVGETWTWGFYNNQYDCNSLNSGGSRTAQETDTEIDLFTWGYGIWSTNPISAYHGDTFTDWGTTINNNGTWCTLSGGNGGEWQYLLENRTSAADKVGFATVAGVNGIIVLPDTFTDPMKNNGSGAFVSKSTTGWSSNVYTVGENWDAMEAAGALFLPAAGSRGGDSISYGDKGYYWSSTSSSSENAYHIGFTSTIVSSKGNRGSTNGQSVRLVSVIVQ